MVLAAVNQDGLALEFASERLKGNKQIVFAACQNNEAKALKYATKPAVAYVCSKDWRKLEHAPEELKNDKDVVFAAISQNLEALQFAGKDLYNEIAKCTRIADYDRLHSKEGFSSVINCISQLGFCEGVYEMPKMHTYLLCQIFARVSENASSSSSSRDNPEEQLKKKLAEKELKITELTKKLQSLNHTEIEKLE